MIVWLLVGFAAGLTLGATLGVVVMGALASQRRGGLLEFTPTPERTPDPDCWWRDAA